LRIVAIMTIRNEELYLPRVLANLYNQGIEVCLVDNGSTDSSPEIARSFLEKGVARIEQLPYKGFYDLFSILENERKLVKEIDADWFIHHDADEIREAPMPPYKTLYEGIQDVDRMGYNAINFDEFVFLPTSDEEHYEGTDYIKEMRYYYLFEPGPLRRVNAWKNLKKPIDLKSWGGHQVNFTDRRIFPGNFIMRHYIALSKVHIIKKYGERVYSKYEVNELGWHKYRIGFRTDRLVFPKKEDICCTDTNHWDRSKPRHQHLFLKQ